MKGLVGTMPVDEEAKKTIIHNHYSHSFPSGKSHAFRIEDVVVVFSIPANKNIAKFVLGRECSVWELTRLWAPDGHKKKRINRGYFFGGECVSRNGAKCGCLSVFR